jgi:hypothetical protein
MPFLHCEEREKYIKSILERKKCEREFKNRGFHPRRNLDEAGYGYLSARNLDRRNKDRLLTRFLNHENKQRKTANRGEVPDLLMVVDQLWL